MMTDVQAEVLACRQEGCQVASTGHCLEGFTTLEDCPHLFPRGEPHDLSGIGSAARSGQDTAPATNVALSSGEDLTPEAASAITQRSVTRVILFAGAAGSGKTTLMASIYEQFQEHPLAGYLFAGSHTLAGFEQRCHLARIASERPRPDTERTSIAQGLRFLHLCVRREDLHDPSRDLLLADISGERFRLARDSTDECEGLDILLRADRLVILVDCERLIESRKRHQAAVEPQTLVRSFLDAEMLTRHTHVDVVFAKWDLVQTAGAGHAGLSYIDTVRAQFTERFDGRVRDLRFFYIAARPIPAADMPIGAGLDDLFKAWMTEDAPDRHRMNAAHFYTGANREFDHYLWKRFPNCTTVGQGG